jgi:transcriptional regulator with XRE-family HTH domain
MCPVFVGEEANWIVNFSYNLRYMIRDKQSSATKVGNQTGIHPAMIRRFMKGLSKPSREQIELIASALECDVSELTDNVYNYTMSISED